MNTTLKILSFLLGAGLPSATLAEFAGLQLPTVVGVGHLFSAFVIVLTLLTAFSDYSREGKSGSLQPTPLPSLARFDSAGLDAARTRLAA